MEVYSKEEIVKYLDVDRTNKLSNQAIINYMQDVAVCHADSVGDGLNNKPETHTAWLLLNWKVRVFDRPKCEDKLKIAHGQGRWKSAILGVSLKYIMGRN